MRIDVLTLDGVFDTGLAALLDVFGTANELSGGQHPLRVRTVGVRRRVHTALGLRVPVQAADDRDPPDVMVAAALGTKTPQALEAALRRRDVSDAVALLRERSEDGTRLAACSGEGDIKLWELSNYQEVATFRGHKDWHERLGFTADGDVLISMGYMGVHLWRAPSPANQ